MRIEPQTAFQILNMLVEGMTVRGCERLTRVHRDTILNLLRVAGEKCIQLHKERVKGLTVGSVQVDEVWTRVFCSNRNTERSDQGDQFAFLGMSRETKLIIGYHVGKRDWNSAFAIMNELKRRIRGRFQLTTDAFKGFRRAVGGVFYNTIDYATVLKRFASKISEATHRYSPPVCVGVTKRNVFGTPYPRLVSTSHIERQNLNVRHFNKRFCRLTLGYSKKLMNLRYAVALYVAHANFCRIHSALDGQTPAMAAGLTDHVWTVEELLKGSFKANRTASTPASN